jgi:predicted alpha/beta superfamily hydrolase
MRSIIPAAIAAAVALGVPAFAACQPLTVVSDAPALPPGFSHFTLHSDRIGRDFEVWVNQPAATPFLPGQKFPVIYALDAGYGIAGPQGLLLSNTGAMTPALIVSVGYKAGEYAFRNTDLLHNKTQLPTGGPMPSLTVGGGGAAFEAFLLEDLKPFIEAKYAADPKRSVLFGHSFGGLFAANVFADRPDAFSAYIIGSASAWADPALLARVAAAAQKASGQRIYLTVGAAEDSVIGMGDARMRNGYEGLAAALKGKPGVVLKTQVYAGETHLSYYPRLVSDGFPFVLPPTRKLDLAQAKMTPEAIARYAGTYRMPDGREIAVKANPQGQLTAQVTGFAVVPLLQNGPDRFYAPTSDIDVVFDASGANLSGGGGKLRIDREKPASTAATQ